MKLGDDKIQVDIVAIPVDEENDVELSVKVGLYINWQLFDNLESDLDGYIKKTLVVPHANEQYITLKLENLSKWIQSKIKNVLILESEKECLVLNENKEKNEILELVSKNWLNLSKEKCKKYIDDYEVVLAAVKQNWLALQFVNMLKNDESICEAAVKQNEFAVQFVPESIRNKEKILKLVFDFSVYNAWIVYKNESFYWVNSDIKWLAYEVSQWHISFDKVINTKHDFVKNNKEFVRILLKKFGYKSKEIFNWMWESLKADYYVMMDFVFHNIDFLLEVSWDLSKYEKFILMKIESDWIEKMKKYLTEEMKMLPSIDDIINKKRKDDAINLAKKSWSFEKEFCNDKEVVTHALEKNVSCLKSMSSELSKDEEFLIDVIKKYWIEKIERYLTEDMRELPRIKKIISENYRSLSLRKAIENWILDEEFKNDKKIVREAIKKDVTNFGKIWEDLLNDEMFINDCIKTLWFDILEKYLINDRFSNMNEVRKNIEKRKLEKEYILNKVRDNWWNLSDEKCKDYVNDFDVVMEAVKQSWLALQFASENLKNNYNIVMEAVGQNWLSLKYSSKDLKNNYDLIISIVKNNWLALQFVSDELKDNYNIVMEAVKQNWLAIQFVSKNLKQKVSLMAIQQNISAVEFSDVPVRGFLQDESCFKVIIPLSIANDQFLIYLSNIWKNQMGISNYSDGYGKYIYSIINILSGECNKTNFDAISEFPIKDYLINKKEVFINIIEKKQYILVNYDTFWGIFYCVWKDLINNIEFIEWIFMLLLKHNQKNSFNFVLSRLYPKFKDENKKMIDEYQKKFL